MYITINRLIKRYQKSTEDSKESVGFDRAQLLHDIVVVVLSSAISK